MSKRVPARQLTCHNALHHNQSQCCENETIQKCDTMARKQKARQRRIPICIVQEVTHAFPGAADFCVRTLMIVPPCDLL